MSFGTQYSAKQGMSVLHCTYYLSYDVDRLFSRNGEEGREYRLYTLTTIQTTESQSVLTHFNILTWHALPLIKLLQVIFIGSYLWLVRRHVYSSSVRERAAVYRVVCAISSFIFQLEIHAHRGTPMAGCGRLTVLKKLWIYIVMKSVLWLVLVVSDHTHGIHTYTRARFI